MRVDTLRPDRPEGTKTLEPLSPSHDPDPPASSNAARGVSLAVAIAGVVWAAIGGVVWFVLR